MWEAIGSSIIGGTTDRAINDHVSACPEALSFPFQQMIRAMRTPGSLIAYYYSVSPKRALTIARMPRRQGHIVIQTQNPAQGGCSSLSFTKSTQEPSLSSG